MKVSASKSATSPSCKTLALTLKDRHDRQQTNRNEGQKCQRFAKLKEVFCQRTCRHKNTTFNFAQPHPKPTHHPTSGLLKIWRQRLTFFLKITLTFANICQVKRKHIENNWDNIKRITRSKRTIA